MKLLFSILILSYSCLRISAQAIPTLSLVKDFSTDYRYAHILDIYNNHLYIDVHTPHEGQLWISDGTEVGTWMLKSFIVNNGYSIIHRGLELNGKYYFWANDGIHGYELWVTDGSETGTYMVKDINPNNSFIEEIPHEPMSVYKDRLYFCADDGIHDRELWATDGTPEGTEIVKDIRIGGNGTGSGPVHYFIFNDKLFFSAHDDIHGEELWVSDGTTNGTKLFKEFAPGFISGNPFVMGIIDNKLYISAGTSYYDPHIWVSDGTPEGTHIMMDVEDDIYSIFFPFHGKYYFSVGGNTTWVTNGSISNTELIDSIQLGDFEYFNDKFFISSSNGNNSEALWVSDGTKNSSIKLFEPEDINQSFHKTVRQLTTYNCKLYFVSSEGNYHSLMYTDGTKAGTHELVNTLAPYDGNQFTSEAISLSLRMTGISTHYKFILDSTLFMIANINDTGWNLWRIEDECDTESPTTNNEFVISPVPACNFITITTQKPSKFTIIDITGKVLHTQFITCSEGIDLSYYKSGVYFIKDENGTVKKFVKSSTL